MSKKLTLVFLTIALILVTTIEAKGGRSGGRSSGRSSSRGSSRGSSRKGSTSSFGSSHTGSHGSSGSGGGWFHGFFHSTPHHYTYSPSYIHTHTYHSSSNSYSEPNREPKEVVEHIKEDNSNMVAGYSISRALSGDFFSLFNVVNDVAKYPERIRNKEYPTTTTVGPVSTYNINDIVPTYPPPIYEPQLIFPTYMPPFSNNDRDSLYDSDLYNGEITEYLTKVRKETEDMFKNMEVLSETTTVDPVSTFNLNDIIPTYLTSTSEAQPAKVDQNPLTQFL